MIPKDEIGGFWALLNIKKIVNLSTSINTKIKVGYFRVLHLSRDSQPPVIDCVVQHSKGESGESHAMLGKTFGYFLDTKHTFGF